jgi:hypothetical protein
LFGSHGLDHPRNLLSGRCIERHEHRTSFFGEVYAALAGIGGGASAPQVAPSLEFCHQSAKVAQVHGQFVRYLGRGAAFVVGQFIQNAGFGERKFAAQESPIQKTQLSGVEPIEAADVVDELDRRRLMARGGRVLGGGNRRFHKAEWWAILLD